MLSGSAKDQTDFTKDQAGFPKNHPDLFGDLTDLSQNHPDLEKDQEGFVRSLHMSQDSLPRFGMVWGGFEVVWPGFSRNRSVGEGIRWFRRSYPTLASPLLSATRPFFAEHRPAAARMSSSLMAGADAEGEAGPRKGLY